MGGGRRRPSKNGGRGRAQAAGANTFSYVHAGLRGRPGEGSSGGRARMDGDRRMRGRGNAFGYTYAHAESSGGGDDHRRPIFLSSSWDAPPTEAFVDPSPCVHLEAEIPSYEYHPSVVGGLGLGYHGEEVDAEQEDVVDTLGLDLEMIGGVGLGFHHGEEEGGEEEEAEEIVGLGSFSTPETTKNVRNEGYLSIGGVRIYTEDTSSPEEEIDLSKDDDSDDEDADQVEDVMLDLVESSDDEEDMEESSQGDGEEDEEDDSSSEGDSLSSDSGSDIDDEVAQDYLKGIGEDVELLNIDFLEAANLDSSDEDGLSKSAKNLGKHRTKLTTIGLMNLSSEYGMKNPKAKKPKGHMRYSTNDWPAANVGASAVEDFVFLKDSRAALRKKKSSSDLSRSWPRESVTRRKSNGPGGKKKHRKELVAVKRRQRMINRGVDLDQINYKLRQLVVSDVDMFSFQPMHPRDCSQVQRLASIYHLKSGCQGSGKKRFVTVSRTKKTCLPSIRDKVLLDKFLGLRVDDVDDFVVGSHAKTQPRRRAKAKGSITREHQSAPAKLAKKYEPKGSGKRFQKQQYSKRPVSFVSSGVLQDGTEKETPSMDPDTTNTTSVAMVTNTNSSIGAFEVHTKGFGSRMMTKMGFVEGSGLGKEGQGIVQPIEVVQRPKLLGLGIQFEAETSNRKNNGQEKTETAGIGGFEKHTKGFGSRMMAKMGFVPGIGLGKDGQGITTPLTAVKRPKSLGLGAKTS